MKLNEEKLTAYALNELPDDERQAVENELTPEARQTVEEIRKLAGQLSEHYAAEENIGLTDEQREAICAAARKNKSKIINLPPRYVWMPLTSAAALIVIIFGLAMPKITGRMSQDAEDETRQQSVAFIPAEPSPTMDLRHPPALRKPKAEEFAQTQRIVSKSSGSTASIVLSDMDDSSGLGDNIGGFEMMENPSKMTLMGGGINVRQKEEPQPSRWVPSIENYAEIEENMFNRVADNPLSTFSIDVDTASYANARRFLKNGRLPPKDAVRIEEMINYFDYNYAPPTGEVPFSANFAQAVCPWNKSHKLVRIGLKGREIAQATRPPLNLTFLLDVSGSMNSPNKLPLVKRSMEMLTNQLDERDRVSIVVYAGASGLVLPPTSGANRRAILGALERLNAGGGTAGGAGIQLAYQTALENFHKDGVNRVILCTDGDFNIGVTQGGDLNRLIEEKAKGGIFLSVLGFGMGNYKDGTLEGLADRGNGNYAYIDTFIEARKVLVDQMSGTLVTIAKDVKIQVEFNPVKVAGYRLIGYENRMLAAEDFNDDTKDAGEIGAGHTVTALYEIIPAGQPVNGVPPVDELKYQVEGSLPVASDELLTVKLRYKQPDSDTSSKLEFPLKDEDRSFEQADPDFRFATSVAGFGMLLRDSEFKGDLSWERVQNWAQSALGEDEFGYRRECLDLIRNAAALKK